MIFIKNVDLTLRKQDVKIKPVAYNQNSSSTLHLCLDLCYLSTLR